MTERWESELQQLRQVSAPPGLQGRVTEGPHGDGMPPAPGRGQRVLAGVVAFAVFGAAMWLAAGGFGHDDAPGPLATVSVPASAVLTLVAGENDPEETLSFAGTSVAGSSIGYCWNQENGVQKCADAFWLPTFAVSDFLPVPQGTAFVLDNPDAADPVELAVAPGDDPSVIGRGTTLGDLGALEPGRYVLSVTASWKGRGEHITFHFPVEVVGTTPLPTDAPGVAVIDVQRQPPRVILTYGDQRQVGDISDTWQPNGDPLEDHRTTAPPELLGTFLVVPPGTPLVVNGDLSEWLTVPQSDADPSVLPTAPGPVVLTLRGLWRADLAFDASFGLLVAEPGSTLTVPDVVGLGDMGAIRALHAAGLLWRITNEAAPGVKQWTVARSDPAPGTQVPPGSVVHVAVATEVTPLPPGAEDALSCPADQRVAFGGPHQMTADLRSGEGQIRRIGIPAGDQVVRADTRKTDEGLWHVVRDGEVIAVVDYATLDGVACAGSGVAGV